MNQQTAVNLSDNNVIQFEKQFFGESENKSQIVEFEKIFRLLLRYKFLLLLLLLLGALTGYLSATSKTPLFRTTANIVVEPESSNRAEYLNSNSRYFIPRSFYETQMVVLKSKAVLEKAVSTLSPVIIERMFREPDGNWYSNYVLDLKTRIHSWMVMLGIGSTDSPNPASTEISENITELVYSTGQVVAKLNQSVSVGFGTTKQIISLTSISKDPLVAAVTANAIADGYVNYLVENRVSQTERAGQWLAERIEDSRTKLSESENALRQFQVNEQLFDLTTVKSLSSDSLGTVNSALLSARQNYAELSKKYGPKHPALIEAKKKLASAQNQYGSVTRQDLNANENRFELTKLERAVNSNRELYELFLSRFNEVELGIDSVSSNTKVLERAGVPSSPFSPDVKNETSKGAVYGILLGVLLLVAREFFDRTFKNQVAVEERLQLPVMGVLPLLSHSKFGKKRINTSPEYYYHENSKSNFAEIVNHIRTGIIYSNVDNPPKVILVTSALPKEGKTTCSTNLSLAFAKLGRTLLIDADFRKPRIAKITNVDNIKGLTGYVAGRNTLQECISQDTDSENLFIMKSGEVPPNPLELLSSKRFEKTLELMKKNFDYIIIDSAPIIPVSDGVVLGKLADSIILVVKAGSTTYHIAESALKRFSSAKLKPVGVVLSQMNYKTSTDYYGKYEYYGGESYG